MIKLDLRDKLSYNQISDKDHKQRLVIIGVKAIHRENLGAKTLVCVYDSWFTNINKDF